MKIVFIILGILLSLFIVYRVIAQQSVKNIEEYPYELIKTYPGFELRAYEASLFTSVKLNTSAYGEASGSGFRVLANYIFGGNEDSQKIAMTSPVAMSLEDSMTMMFMVPSSYKKENLPKPNNSNIKFKEMPPKKMAAIRFSGWANDEKIEEHKQLLIKGLNKQGIPFKEPFYFMGYDPPYEIINRRNEVVVEVLE